MTTDIIPWGECLFLAVDHSVVTYSPNGVVSIPPAALAPFTSTGSLVARAMKDRASDWGIVAADWGVVADGATDDTAALQLAINAAETANKILFLSPGTSMITGVTITKPLIMVGHGKWGSILKLKTGSASPAISVSITTANFLSVAGFADVTLADFQITSPNRTDAPGVGVAHGISLLQPASPQTAAVKLHGMLINEVPGDGIHSAAFTGFVEATDVEISYPGGYGVYANSVVDWIFTGGNIYGALQDNVLLSGSTNFRFDRLNVFVAVGHNINCFNSNPVFVNCMIDLTGKDGLYANNTNGLRIDLIGCTLRWASTGANATYSPLWLSSSNTGPVYLTGCNFPTLASAPGSNKPLNNINFEAGNTALAYLVNTAFDLGVVGTAGVTNDTTKIAWQVPGVAGSFTTLAVAGNVTVTASLPTVALWDTAQTSGLRRMVIQNNSQQVQVYSTDDAGTLQTLGLTVARNGAVNAPVTLRAGAIDTTPIGATTPSTGAFTTLAAAGNVTVTASTPSVVLWDTAQSANLRRMVIQNNSQQVQIYSTNDAGALTTLGMTIARNGAVNIPVVLTAGATSATSLDSTPIGSTTPSTGVFVGVTNGGNAAAGQVGEVISSTVAVGSAVSLTSVTPKTVTSISLTAGDWDVEGAVVFGNPGTTTLTTYITAVNTTTNVLPAAGLYSQAYPNSSAGLTPSAPTPYQRISVGSTTTVFLVAYAAFAVSTLTAYGFISARRAR